MGKVQQVIKKGLGVLPKRAWIILLVLLVIVPISFFLATARVEEDDEFWEHEGTRWSRRDVEDIQHQLRNARCPAQFGKKLKDFWMCLFGTTITADGWKQHEQWQWERERKYEEAMFKAEMEWAKDQERARKGENINKTFLVRKARQAPPPPEPKKSFLQEKADDYLYDTRSLRVFDQKRFMECQQKINPASNINEFLYCIRYSNKLRAANSNFGKSHNATYQTTTFPPFESEYDPDEMELVTVTIQDQGQSRDVRLKYDFKTMTNEENSPIFFGADPYLVNDDSPYRYKYDNTKRQEQPAWSYSGAKSAAQWHDINLKEFFVPMKDDADFEDIALTPELIQTYPILGTFAEIMKRGAPIEYRWSKDMGRFAYTRFLPPLVTKDDLEYYKAKGLISEEVTPKPIWLTMDEMSRDLKEIKTYEVGAEQFYPDDELDNYGRVKNPHHEYTLKYGKSYRDFIEYFWGIPTGPLRKQVYDYNVALAKHYNQQTQATLENSLNEYMAYSRVLLHAYINVAAAQIDCVKTMINEITSDRELTTEADMDTMIEAAKMDENCPVVEDEEVAVQENCTTHGKLGGQAGKIVDCDEYNLEPDSKQPRPKWWGLPTLNVSYKIPEESLKNLYKSYWERSRARQRYSLPVFPKPYPICRHNNPSPIDIDTSSVTESTLRDYVFGDAAYRLNRFFMFFPLDGSPLLTVGIADGERLDSSTVKMTGGAVRGHALYFQYMHIHFARDWTEIGSEHRLNGKGAPMELQMVFTISGSADALKYWHILARVQNQLFQFRDQLVIVLSVLVDVEATDEDVVKKIKEKGLNQDPYLFEPLAQAAYHFYKMPQKFDQYEEPRGYVSMDPVFRFIEFIPRVTSNFYTYRGSLTWPPCFPYVIWSVYEERLVMSKRQFDQFIRIPAYGINDNQYVAGNIRKFDDIWVEEEKEPSLLWYQREILMEIRTVDRPILGGVHTVEADGSEHSKENNHIVEDAVYEWQGRPTHKKSSAVKSRLSPCLVTLVLTIAQTFNFNFVI